MYVRSPKLLMMWWEFQVQFGTELVVKKMLLGKVEQLLPCTLLPILKPKWKRLSSNFYMVRLHVTNLSQADRVCGLYRPLNNVPGSQNCGYMNSRWLWCHRWRKYGNFSSSGFISALKNVLASLLYCFQFNAEQQFALLVTTTSFF